MGIQVLFPTLVYAARLRSRGWRALNRRLLHECRQLRVDDPAGRRWSARNYPGGYTSYGSAHRMQSRWPTFAALARELDRHVARFTRSLQMDLSARALAMTDCWVNIMGRSSAHGLHLHLRRRSRGCAGTEVRGSAARALHGRTAAPQRSRPSPARPSASASVSMTTGSSGRAGFRHVNFQCERALQ